MAEGNVFIHDCYSVYRGGCVCVCLSMQWAAGVSPLGPEGVHPRQTPLSRHPQADTPWADPAM